MALHIVAASAAKIPEKIARRFGIAVVPLHLRFGEEFLSALSRQGDKGPEVSVASVGSIVGIYSGPDTIGLTNMAVIS